jgi:hypothetical protein
MIVQLALVFFLPAHLSHVFQGVEHGLHNSVVRAVHALPNFERLRSNELVFNAPDIDGEVFDEMGYSIAFLTSQFGFSYRLDLLRLHRQTNIIDTSVHRCKFAVTYDVSLKETFQPRVLFV